MDYMTTLAKPRIDWPRLALSAGVSLGLAGLVIFGLRLVWVCEPGYRNPVQLELRPKRPPGCGWPESPKTVDLISYRTECPLHGTRLVETKMSVYTGSGILRAVPADVENTQFPFAVPSLDSETKYLLRHGELIVIFSRCGECAGARQAWLNEHSPKTRSSSKDESSGIDLGDLAIPLDAPVSDSPHVLPEALIDPFLPTP